jgi:hypothetical protein
MPQLVGRQAGRQAVDEPWATGKLTRRGKSKSGTSRGYGTTAVV